MKNINENKAFLQPALCRTIAAQAAALKPDLRVELTMRGEPTLNPYILENVTSIRELAPKFQISLFTNGVLILRDPGLIRRLLDAGVNILCVECYNNTYEKFQRIAKESGETVVDFRQFSAYKRHPRGYRLRVINLVPDIREGTVAVRKIHNNAGSVSPEYLASLKGYQEKVLPLKKGCTRPFRELVVAHNGDVLICCHDWKTECVLGNVQEETLSDIWYGKKHYQILCSLYQKDRSCSPCCNCDYHGGYRFGFLKNPLSATKNPEQLPTPG